MVSTTSGPKLRSRQKRALRGRNTVLGERKASREVIGCRPIMTGPFVVSGDKINMAASLFLTRSASGKLTSGVTQLTRSSPEVRRSYEWIPSLILVQKEDSSRKYIAHQRDGVPERSSTLSAYRNSSKPCGNYI